MTFLPIVERELRVATRRPMTYWSRVMAALVAITLTIWMVGTLGRIFTPELVGAKIFRTLSTLAFFFCLFPGVVLTADCLSEEKRAGTLGLLFLTDLKGYDVVFGKLVATSLRAFYAFLAILPLMALPFFLGGVTAGEFWRMIAVLANTLFFSLALGMLFSAASWQEQWAMLGTSLLIIMMAFIVPYLGGIFSLLNLQTPFRLAYDGAFQKEMGAFVFSWVRIHLLAWGCLLVASHVVLLSWRKKELAPAEVPGQASGLFSWPWAPRRKYCGGNPIEWLGVMGQKTWFIWISLLVPLAVWGLGFARNGKSWWHPGKVFLIVVGWHCIFQFWIAWEASRSLNAARRTGALEQVLSTPLTSTEIIDGLMRALERQFFPMLGVLVVLDTGLLLMMSGWLNWRTEQGISVGCAFAGYAFTSVFQSYAMAWVGLWLGLTSSRAAQAALSTLTRAVLLPTGLFLIGVYFLLVAGRLGSHTFLIGCSGIWVMTGGATAYLLFVGAQQKLHANLRAAAVFNERIPRAQVEIKTNDWNEDFSLLR